MYDANLTDYPAWQVDVWAAESDDDDDDDDDDEDEDEDAEGEGDDNGDISMQTTQAEEPQNNDVPQSGNAEEPTDGSVGAQPAQPPVTLWGFDVDDDDDEED